MCGNPHLWQHQGRLIWSCNQSVFPGLQSSVVDLRGLRAVFFFLWLWAKIIYPLVNVYITIERSTIFNGKIHYKWSFSITMLNYQRVTAPRKSWMIGHGADCFDSQVMVEIGETEFWTSILAWCKSGSHINTYITYKQNPWRYSMVLLSTKSTAYLIWLTPEVWYWQCPSHFESDWFDICTFKGSWRLAAGRCFA